MRSQLYDVIIAAAVFGITGSLPTLAEVSWPLAGQVMHLSFDRVSGTRVADECDPALAAELCNGARIEAGGVSGNALVLNGTSAFARLSRNPTTSDVYTVSLWFRVSRAARASIQSATLFSYNRRYQIGLQASGPKVLLYSYALNLPSYGYGAFEARSDPFVPPFDRWCHVAIVVYGGISFYLDGRTIGTLSGHGANRGDTEVLIGALNNDRSFGPRCFWSGAVDEVRVFARALTADEIVAVMAKDSPRLAAERVAPVYRLKDDRMFVCEFVHGRDVERPLSSTEMRQVAQQFASPAAPAGSLADTNRPTTVIGLSNAWDGRQDQNVFRRGDSVYVKVVDADYSDATNCLFGALLWQGATNPEEDIRQHVTLTNDASGAWRGIIPCEPFLAGEADLVVTGMDDTGRPVLMRSATITIQDVRVERNRPAL